MSTDAFIGKIFVRKGIQHGILKGTRLAEQFVFEEDLPANVQVIGDPDEKPIPGKIVLYCEKNKLHK